MSRSVKLTVINDFVCPNCCIGQHELLNAITYCKENLHLPLNFEFVHMPFRLVSTNILSEDSPKVEKVDFYRKQLGEDGFTKMKDAITKWANENDVPIIFKGFISQTTRAHRLCQKAYQIGGQDLQIPLLRTIYKAHMEEGRDIAEIAVLADIAADAGTMSREEATAFLESDELVKEVDAMCDDARSKGITGVPVIIIDGKWAISGGQSSDVFIQIFKKLAAARGSASPPPLSGPEENVIGATVLTT
ncbi:thioredoxin-like protein [Phlegmacium glaucopus]|nr:thioredoxin-like protein [Phlegmacium glaucopus]